MNLVKVLSLGMETMDRIPKVSILKTRQLAGSASFHLLHRQQNGLEEEQFHPGSETVLTACSIHLAVIRKTLSQDSAPPLRFQYSPQIPSIVPCKNHHKDRKWMLRKQETKKRSECFSKSSSNTPCNSGNQKGPVELVHPISASSDKCRTQL